jgi:hypothetical protein
MTAAERRLDEEPAPRPAVVGCAHPSDPWCRDSGTLCPRCLNDEIDRMNRRIPA